MSGQALYHYTFAPWLVSDESRIVVSKSSWRRPVGWDQMARDGVCNNCAGMAADDGHPCDMCHETGRVEPYRGRVLCTVDIFEDWQGPMLNARGEVLFLSPKGNWLTGNSEQLYSEGHPIGVRPPEVTMAHVRARLFRLIDDTPNLDWLIVTSHPENVARMMPTSDDGHGGALAEAIFCSPGKLIRTRPNLWLGVPATTQREADDLIPKLLRCPAAVRVVVIDPLLEAISLSYETGTHAHLPGCLLDDIHWVIVGGESGPGARPCSVDWVRSIVRQCQKAGVACFVKQLGAVIHARNIIDPLDQFQCKNGLHLSFGQGPDEDTMEIRLIDRNGGDPDEWPDDLRVMETPGGGER